MCYLCLSKIQQKEEVEIFKIFVQTYKRRASSARIIGDDDGRRWDDNIAYMLYIVCWSKNYIDHLHITILIGTRNSKCGRLTICLSLPHTHTHQQCHLFWLFINRFGVVFLGPMIVSWHFNKQTMYFSRYYSVKVEYKQLVVWFHSHTHKIVLLC